MTSDLSSASLQKSLLILMSAPEISQADFDRQALTTFAHQYAYNLPFQRFCQQRGKTPRTVKSWRDIPAVPISGFKELTLSCTPPASAARIFMTSGTTQADVRGKHYHPHLLVYDESMTRHFSQRFMRGHNKIRMGILFPSETLMPNSSLAHYLALAKTRFGTSDSVYLIDESGVNLPLAISDLTDAQNSGQPYALLGASYSLVHLMDALQAQGLEFKLPVGSRVLDTGGFKGQSRELTPEAFYEQLAKTFGVHASHCINMYGMTELSTQFYDDGNATWPSVKSGPGWIRTRVVDHMTGEDMPDGVPGVLVHCDLANFNSVSTILTEDVGVIAPEGFVLMGRAGGSAAKGCSLAVEEFLKAAKA
jgi:phenylacetate-coenzyme A ligase PaaK-like adenylate-forming protein